MAAGKPRNRCLYLLIGLVFILLAQPFFQYSAVLAKSVLVLLMVVVLLGGVLAVRAKVRNVYIAGAAGVIAAGASVVQYVDPSVLTGVVSLSVAIVFFGFVTVSILHYVMGGRRVTVDRLFGSACVYLLMGMTWALLYAFIDTVQSDAFVGPTLGTDPMHLSELTYFSFATLTTLVYGDIRPVSLHARSLAVLEAVTGVFYMAVLVARLVAMYVATAAREGGSAPPTEENR